MIVFNKDMDFNVVEIIKDKKFLSPEYMPNKIIGRKKEIDDLSFHLSYFFRENPSLPSFIISGSSGTGKTLVVKKILQGFQEEANKKKSKVKIVFIKGSESRSKYEVLKSILKQLCGDKKLPRTSSDCYDKIVNFLATSESSVLIVIDEIHEIKNSEELNNLLFTISRFGEDMAFYQEGEQKILKNKNTHYGYILITNDALMTKDLNQNTKSSLTRDRIHFPRYSPDEVFEILQDRIKKGAFHKNKIKENHLKYISALSIQEGEDARYGLLLLSNIAKYAEKNRLVISDDVIVEVNNGLRKRLLLEIILDLPWIYKKILKIIVDLFNEKVDINSKKIFELYDSDPSNKNLNFSRICQIVTFLEKEKIVYVKGSNGNNLRKLTIGENIIEIKHALTEEGLL